MEAREWQDFLSFARSGVFSAHLDTLRFLEELVVHFPHFYRKDIPDEGLFAKLYPGQPYRDEQMRTLRKYALDLLMDFWAWRAWQADPLQPGLSRLRAARTRRLWKMYASESKKLAGRFQRYPYRDTGWYLARWQMEETTLEVKVTTESRTQPVSLAPAQEALEHFFLINSLGLACSGINQQELLGVSFQLSDLMKTAISYCRAHQDTLEPAIAIYFHLYGLLATEQHKQHFIRLKLLLRASMDILPPSDLGNIYNQAINYCNRQHRAGEPEYEREMFFLYREMLDLGLLREGSMLSANHFKNLVTLGLRLGELEWTEDFIETYQSQLEGQYQVAAYTYNKAHLLFYKDEFGKALRIMQEVEYLDPFYRISAQMLQLKIYFEQQNIEAFLSLVDAFRTFLRRRDWPRHRKRSYLNFALLIRALLMVRISSSDSTALREQIRSTNPLIEREWLLSALDKMTRQTL